MLSCDANSHFWEFPNSACKPTCWICNSPSWRCCCCDRFSASDSFSDSRCHSQIRHQSAHSRPKRIAIHQVQMLNARLTRHYKMQEHRVSARTSMQEHLKLAVVGSSGKFGLLFCYSYCWYFALSHPGFSIVYYPFTWSLPCQSMCPSFSQIQSLPVVPSSSRSASISLFHG